jgi:GNAT superfamily N-acetyltransferase
MSIHRYHETALPKQDAFAPLTFVPLSLRPLALADAAAHRAFLLALNEQDRRFRRFGLAQGTDGGRGERPAPGGLTILATRQAGEDSSEVLGELRLRVDPARLVAEFALAVRSDLQGLGLGRLLMGRLLDECRARGVALVRGAALARNVRMHRLARAHGFQALRAADGTVELLLLLRGVA